MSLIIKIEDFVGFYKISRNSYGDNYIQGLIDNYENFYLNILLQKDIKDSLLADLDVNGLPQDIEIKDWFDEFQNEYEGCNNNDYIYSEGFKKVLLGLVYYEIIRLIPFNQSTVGSSTPKEANSVLLTAWETERLAEQRYNKAVFSMKAINRKQNWKDKIEFKYLDLI